MTDDSVTDDSASDDSADAVRRRLQPAEATLPCGRRVDETLEQAAEGGADDLDDHQSTCPHCQAALLEFSALWQPVRDLVAAPVAAPADLADRVMRRVHQMVTDTWFTLQLTELGSLKIAARIVARIARDAARQVPGVRVALGRSTASRLVRLVERASFSHRHPDAAVGVLGRTAAVELAVAVQYGEPVHDIAREVQQRVILQLRESIGLESVTVNVTVDDVMQ